MTATAPRRPAARPGEIATVPTRRRVLVTAALAAAARFADAQSAATEGRRAAPPLDAEEQAQVLDALADQLETRYVFPEVGQRHATMLRERRRAGSHAALRDAEAFAAAVTAELQAVHPDRHLALRVRDADTSHGVAAASFGTRLVALERAELLGEVAYLKFNLFPDDPAVADAVRRFLTGAGAAARAVVIDARTHRGGSLIVMDALLPLLYAEPRTLVRMDTRAGGFGADGGVGTATLQRREAPPTVVRHDHVVAPDPRHRALQSVPVFYLTSGRTASAAEHLALALQSSGRATIVGETTRGAGHYGERVAIGRFGAFVPVGRTYDPRTGQDWEGRGIRPDVDVPAAQALDKVLELLAARGIRTAG